MPAPAHRLGLGLAAIARPAYITSGRAGELGDDRDVATLRDRSRALLDAAYAAGVRYLDVARSYGRAEEFLAGWLADRPGVTGGEDPVEIGSKWGYRYVGGWRTDADTHEVKDHSLDAFTEQYALSRELLGDHLGTYHVHSATLDTGVLDDGRVHRAMAHLRDRGIRVGISTSGPAQADAVRRALDVRVDGEPLFTSFQSTWNPLEPSVGPALAEAADAGARVIVKEVFANGRLAPGGEDGTEGARAAAALAARTGVPLDRIAVAAALANPWAWRVLLGPVGTDQLASNLAGAELTLPADAAEELTALAEPAEHYWATRSARPWS
ncbi:MULTISPECIES: aldo/keto reductase [Pseudonocardia]|jgi:aryl-alcohol dehydrogenase-like predicted oxidoreductase|uniref:Aryl-alcohol dehydrogenase-like predicted oxidoreductase n=1 Tax=Pseudonocardia alni TaxID=33907 RepID=A0A852W9Q0_PSEA5|nr:MULTISPECIES: aldo/keto reductase [Pseudonocardia]MCO7197184.1 aldo/keto reductase [Pseudonocardia sp. McavD-2-B]MYW75630.1 aldo/keto reductase [Pseudonocardia sp. SID8383]NYG03035.1 aryl-alcohol dehydrogenase-like predicted oxidoreductase [Pseudonocardia antarctica]OJG06184.1 Aldo/keto reductase family protein [Pseudonocardia autotrophica]